MHGDLITLEDGTVVDTRQMTIEDLRGVIKRIEIEQLIGGGERMPPGYIRLVTELYQRTGGKAPGERRKVAMYGDSKKPKSTWRKL